MRHSTLLACCSFVLIGWVGASPCRAQRGIDVNESAMTLYVRIEPDPSPGLYDYQFKLVLDNHTGNWLPGTGYGGLIFGDVANAPSPLADFTLTSVSPNSPWNELDPNGPAAGFHNGPIFFPEIDADLNPVYWVPTGIGDSISWKGMSATGVSSLTFSTLFSEGGDPNNPENPDFANFQPAVIVPEPAPWVVGVEGGLLLLAYAARARWRRRVGSVAVGR